MSVRPGTPIVISSTTAALAVAAGRNIALQSSNTVIVAVAIVYVASGTGGNRVPTVRFLDPNGNILWSAVFATAVTSGQTSRLLAGSAVPSGNTTTPLQQTFPIPVEFSVPANSTIQILDAANVDTADTVQANITLSA